VDHIHDRGRDFFEVACAHDLEGIVAKPANGRYHSDGTNTNWVKIKNPSYTQMTARHELFETLGRRGTLYSPADLQHCGQQVIDARPLLEQVQHAALVLDELHLEGCARVS
jgi:hypothetical protein